MLACFLVGVLLMRTAAAQAPERRGFVLVVFVEDAQGTRAAAIARAVPAHFASETSSLDLLLMPRAPTLREQADRLAERLVRDTRAGGFWLDLSQPAEAQLYFIEPDAKRVLVRRIAWQDDATTSEEIAVVVRATAEAVTQGATIGMTPVIVPPPATTAPPVAPAPAAPVLPSPFRTEITAAAPPARTIEGGAAPWRWPGTDEDERRRWSLHAALDMTSISSDLPLLAGLHVGGAYEVLDHFWVEAGVAAHPGSELVTDEGDRLSLRKARLELAAGYRAQFGWIAFGASGGFFGELLTRTTLDLRQADVPTPAATSGLVGAFASGQIGFTTEGIDGFLRLGPELVFNPLSFEITGANGEQRTISEVSVIRARAVLGLALRFQ